jgi:sugar phosphate isomerase/epimerase
VLVLILAVTAHAANPFFAMDTAVRDLNELETVKELGYAGIGWKVGPGDQVAAASKQCQERGLKLFAIYGGATLTKSNLTWSSNIEADIVALKGTGTIIWLPINSKEVAKSSPDGDAVAVPALQRLADRAAENGVRIAIYPHTGCWAERAQDAVRLAQKVGRKNFGATFNLCHCLMVGDEAKIPEILTEAAPHLFLVTINGADKDAGHTKWDRLIQPLDAGSYDVGIVLRKLKELNYTGPIGLQGYGVKLPAKENLMRSMNGWRKLNP